MNSNISKTFNYMKRNGLVKTVYAVKERVSEKKTLSSYTYIPLSEEERLKELEEGLHYRTTFSILVPAYETPEPFLRAMIESVIAQTYPRWELVIADASESDTVRRIAASYEDIRIHCLRLSENRGISANTNEGLKECTGDYTGLLDHDDLLANDALFTYARAIAVAEKDGEGNDIQLQLLYSNEDKTNAENTTYFECNTKPKFNLDLILSNNYACHFLAIKTDLLKKLRLRSALDGAQDHDLILRAVRELKSIHGEDYPNYIYHADRVLYHWRCHEHSTAQNPKSKSYAYEAGLKAVADFVKNELADGAPVRISRGKRNAKKQEGAGIDIYPTAHLGFFYVDYRPDIFAYRKKVCAVGGRMIDKKGKVVGGAYDGDKRLLFEGLSVHHSGGYLHRADCQMTVPYLEIDCMRFPPEGRDSAHAAETLNKMLEENNRAEHPLSQRELSFRFCDRMRERGFTFVYDPEIIVKCAK